MIKCLVKEIQIRSAAKNQDEDTAVLLSEDEIIETIYFGGGTPSLLSKEEIFSLISTIQQNYKVDKEAEITLEANPDDITIEKLNDWKSAGINRLSIGIQSFLEKDLLWMNRAHNAAQALNCIRLARNTGFDNFSVDLIFGLPGLTDDEWKQNIEKAISLNIPHLSSYALTVEPKTALQKMIQLKKKEDVDNDLQSTQYVILMQMMRSAGYEHYEISNFAKPGFRSRHNSSYWQGEKYIGIGPSAHSYNGKIRMWNKAHNVFYIKSMEQNIIPFEKEILSESQRINEYVMTSLRTLEGTDLRFIENTFSTAERNRIEEVLMKEVKKEMIVMNDEKIILTDEGKLFADGIAVKLFL